MRPALAALGGLNASAAQLLVDLPGDDDGFGKFDHLLSLTRTGFPTAIRGRSESAPEQAPPLLWGLPRAVTLTTYGCRSAGRAPMRAATQSSIVNRQSSIVNA
jgi:hypothetical protein